MGSDFFCELQVSRANQIGRQTYCPILFLKRIDLTIITVPYRKLQQSNSLTPYPPRLHQLILLYVCT